MRLAPLALALLLAPIPATAQEATQQITVALSNFKFTPDNIQLKAGHTYVLHLTSTGGHSFEATAFFAAAKIAPEDRAKIQKGKIELTKAAAVDVHFTAPAAGTFPVRCTHTLHASFGMTGKIVVR